MTPTGKSNRHCFMNAYLAAIPWQSTPSLFLRCRAPGEPRPTPCAIASAQPPILPPCAHPVQPASSTPWHWPPSLLRSPSALTGVSPPPPERALAPGPPSPPRPGIRACSLVFVPFLPPHWVNLTNQECPFLSGYLSSSQFPQLRHLWLDGGYNGQGKGKDWVEKTLGWSAQVVQHPPKIRYVWAPQ